MKVSTLSDRDIPDLQRTQPLRGARLRSLRTALLEWYRPRARPLRIRATRDPWAILVSEVMAQQTQINRVDEAWAVFIARYPAPRSLAAVPTSEVVRAWSGLGYNRRAVNLQRAAAALVADHDGRVPPDIEVLESLPGVGPYTARAVVAIAFGQPVAAVDTNVRRVVTRVVGESLVGAALQAEADAWVDASDPAIWTYASMELGATVCVARRPRCRECPLRDWCASVDEVVTPARRSSSTTVPFEHTSRWLRGRIVERLRALDDGDWERLPPSMGEHSQAEIEAALAGLERDGLLERAADGSVRLPSGTT